MARGSARNAGRYRRVLAGPEQRRHQRRRRPDGDRHRQRGPRREARATGPSEGGRPIEHTSADGDREPGCFLVRVSAAIGVLHGSACNGANVVPHAAGFPVAIVAAVTNDVTDAEPVYLHADTDDERIHADAERVYHHADAQPERVCLHADAHDERIRAHADAERVCLRYLGADAHCFRVGLGTDFGIAHGASSTVAPSASATS